MSRTFKHLLLFFTMLITAAPVIPKSKPIPTEYEVRAAYLYNFIKFVKWPKKTFSDTLQPIIIGIIGKDPIVNTLDEMVKGRTIDSHPIIVKNFQRQNINQVYHVLFIGSVEKRHQISILNNMENKPILTVGDVDYFTKIGGMISFFVEKDHVGFEINLNAVEKSDLEISAKLLKLAKISDTKM